MQVFYTVYRTTNNLNGKYYIGKHKTTNPSDSYFGSGLAIKAAIRKHGRENFTKEVIFVTESEQEAFDYEKKMTEDFRQSDNYNMRRGGPGGFTEEAQRKGVAASKLAGAQVKGGIAAVSQKSGVHSLSGDAHKENGRKGGRNNTKPKSEAHKQAMREAYYRRIAQR